MSGKSKVAAPAAAPKIARAYPFDGSVEIGGQKKPMEIVKMTITGFIAHLKTTFVKVGDHYQVHFELPGSGLSVTTQTRVLKTYDKSLDPKAKKIDRMAEFHFEKLTDYHKGIIHSFLSSFGQD